MNIADVQMEGGQSDRSSKYEIDPMVLLDSMFKVINMSSFQVVFDPMLKNMFCFVDECFKNKYCFGRQKLLNKTTEKYENELDISNMLNKIRTSY